MDDTRKTKKELIGELNALRQLLQETPSGNKDKKEINNHLPNSSESERRYKQIFETNQAIKLIIDPRKGEIVQANQAAIDFYGFPPDVLIGKKISEINILPKPQLKAEMERAVSEKRLFFNFKHRLASGEVRDVEVYTGPLNEKDGTYLYCIIHDVTAKKQAEKIQKILLNISRATGEAASLKDLLGIIHEQLSSLIECQNFYVALYNIETKKYSFPYYVDEFDSGEDFTQEDLQNSLTEYVRVRGIPLLIDTDSHSQIIKEGKVSLVGRSSHIWMGVPFKINEAFNGVLVIQKYSEGEAYTQQDLEVMTFVTEHISWAIERKKAEQKITESEERYRSLVDNSPLAIAIHTDGKLVFINRTAIRMLRGENESDFIGQTIGKFIHKDFKKVIDERIQKIKKNQSVAPLEEKFICLDGEIIDVEVRAVPLTFKGVDAIQVVITDITDRKESEKNILESEERFRTLIENSPVAITMSRKGKIIFVNDAYLKMFAYSSGKEIIGSSFLFQLADGEREKILKRNTEREQGKNAPKSYETIGKRKDGSLFPFHANVTTIKLPAGLATIAYLSDISEIKNAEEERLNLERQILQTQKLESLGVLAGGIAHDFNNLLTGIMGNTGLAMMHSDETSPALNNLVKIENIASRAAELCNQMLAYSGKGKFVIEAIDLNEMARDMVLLLNVSIPKKVSLHFDLDPKLPAVEADVSQVRQIIMNLITNAADALENKQGSITLKSYTKHFSGKELKSKYIDQKLEDGKYVVLEVTDTGCGMKEETLLNLFDPFFTTKFTGRGLGLAAVLGIVRGHKGTILIDSVFGEGTTIKIILPASDKKVIAVEKIPIRNKKFIIDVTILVVDDEDAVRSIIKETLELKGFKVILAEDGKDALKFYKKYMSDITLVLLDMTMPKLNGEETLKALKKINPKIKVILSSGFSASETMGRFKEGDVSGYLQKPYHLQKLQEKIIEVLEA
jgi:PAS domain S-box-containing protein